MKETKSRWTKKTDEYKKILKLEDKEIKKMNKNHIKEWIRIHDTEVWKLEMQRKSSLEIYRRWKNEIKEEQIYENDRKSEIWFKLRTNSLPL